MKRLSILSPPLKPLSKLENSVKCFTLKSPCKVVRKPFQYQKCFSTSIYSPTHTLCPPLSCYNKARCRHSDNVNSDSVKFLGNGGTICEATCLLVKVTILFKLSDRLSTQLFVEVAKLCFDVRLWRAQPNICVFNYDFLSLQSFNLLIRLCFFMFAPLL